MKRMCSLFDDQNIPWSFKGLERVMVTLMFFFKTLCYETGREKGQKHRTRLDLWVPADCELSFIPQASESGADVIHKPPLKKE